MGYKTEIRRIGKELLPSYSQIGLYEVAIPIYSLEVSCFCNKVKTLPAIQDTLLKLIDQKFELTKIPNMMGLNDDIDIFEKAFYDLLYYEVINKNGIISDIGRDYLRDDQLNRFVKLKKKLYIDGLTGAIFINKRSYINDRNLRESATIPIIKQIRRPTLEKINFYEAKKIMNEENDSEKVIDLLKIDKTNVIYKRAQLAIYQSDQGGNQMLLFDRSIQLTEYDDILENLEISNLANLEMNASSYFSSNNIEKNRIESTNLPEIKDEDCFEKFEHLLFNAKREIQLFIPFTQWTLPDSKLIDLLKNKLSQKINVQLFMTGEILPTNYSMKRIGDLERLAQSYSSLVIHHVVNAFPLCIKVDNQQTCCINFTEHIVGDYRGDIIIYTPIGYELTIQQYNQFIIKDDSKGVPSLTFNTRKDLNMMLKKILDDFYLFDDKQRDLNRKTWRTAGVALSQDHASFEAIPLVKNKNDYEVMLTSINKFLFETLKDKYRAGYFFGDFRNYYPELYTLINKIRLYRNAVQHTRLDKQEDRDMLSAYLKEDTGGRYPGLITNGYATMQYLLLYQLATALRNEMNKL